MKYQFLLFDLDGTLTNPALGITNSILYSLKKFGFQGLKREDFYKFIGPPLVDSFMQYCGFERKKAELALEYYREYFSEKGIFENEIYPGISEFLKLLKEKSYTVILATSKPEKFAFQILKHFNIAQHFDYISGATMDETRSKKSDVIRYALSLASVSDRESAVMIGDRSYDIIGAKENGLDSIGVLYGFGGEKELSGAGADYIVSDVSELKSVLLHKKSGSN